MSGMEAVFSAAVGRHGGVRPLGYREGDAFLAAFARTSEALACALEVQRELQANWLSCLRAALHTGEAQVCDEVRYFGQAVARTGAATRPRPRRPGPGLSRICRPGGRPPPGGGQLDRPRPHRMHDLSRPVQVYQLCHPDLVRRLPASPLPRPPPPQPGGAADQLRRARSGARRGRRAVGPPGPGHRHRLRRVRQDPPSPAGSGRSPGGGSGRGVVRGPVRAGRP